MPKETAADKSMKLLRPISSPDDIPAPFILDVNKHIDVINELITRYNNARDSDKKIKYLKEIRKEQKKMDYRFAPSDITHSEGYQEQIQYHLFKSLRKQFAFYGHSLYEPLSDVEEEHPAHFFAELLAHMSPEKVSILADILSTKTISRLHSLYKCGENHYEKYQCFLTDYSIRFLGGGNSENFVVTRQRDKKQFVLKVDRRLNMPRSMEYQLKAESALQNVFTPVHAERQITHRANTPEQKHTTSTLILTDYYPIGDLQDHSTRHHTRTAKIDAALDLFTQMAAILLLFKKHKCLHPDMKNSNWLVDERGHLRIADTKSLLPAKQGWWFNRAFNIADATKDYSDIVTTSFMNPPEFSGARAKKISISVGKAHSYMFGKNLYLYLQGRYIPLEAQHDGSTYDFSAPVFRKEPAGPALVKIIKALVKENPQERMPLQEVLEELQAIGLKVVQHKAQSWLEKYPPFNIGATSDLQMESYIRNQRTQLLGANLGHSLNFLNRVERECRTLQNDKLPQRIRDLFNTSTPGIQRQLLPLCNLMREIPIPERISASPMLRNNLISQLNRIAEEHQSTQDCLKNLQSIRKYQLSPSEDSAMSSFIALEKEKIEQAIETPSAINARLTTIIQPIQDVHSVLITLKNQINSLKIRYPSVLDMVDIFIQTLYVIPIEERCKDSPALMAIEKKYQCYQALLLIKQDQLYLNDPIMNHYIKTQEALIHSSNDLAGLSHHFSKLHSQLNANALHQLLRDIDLLKPHTDLALEIYNLQSACCNIPVEERIAIPAEIHATYQILLKKAACHQLLKEIQTHSLGSQGKDQEMKKFIDSQKKLITNAYTLGDLEHLRVSLTTCLTQQHQIVPIVRDIIKRFRGSITCFSIQKKKKANEIEAAFLAIPVVQRNSNYFNTGSEINIRRFQEALAYRRRIIGAHLVRNPNGTLNEKKAATSYQQFFKACPKPEAAPSPPDLDAESVSITSAQPSPPHAKS